MKQKLIIHNVDFTNYRLVELIKLANQAEPFYNWVEKKFQIANKSSDSLEQIILQSTKDEILHVIIKCYNEELNTPKLFDGGGTPYSHKRSCFFFFSWLVRDAAIQRLKPLVCLAQKISHKSEKIEAQILAELIYFYREKLQFFDWPVFREVTLSRLEGSRRAIRGSAIEIIIRTAITNSLSYFYKTRGNYGIYDSYELKSTPLKVGNRTYDIVVNLIARESNRLLVFPIKTRETQGGGHSHLFSRDIEQANIEILDHYPTAVITPVIIAQNWDHKELDMIENKYGFVFYFNENPSNFREVDQIDQKKFNIFIEKILE